MIIRIKDGFIPGEGIKVDSEGVPGFLYLATETAAGESVVALDFAGAAQLAGVLVDFIKNHPDPAGSL